MNCGAAQRNVWPARAKFHPQGIWSSASPHLIHCGWGQRQVLPTVGMIKAEQGQTHSGREKTKGGGGETSLTAPPVHSQGQQWLTRHPCHAINVPATNLNEPGRRAVQREPSETNRLLFQSNSFFAGTGSEQRILKYIPGLG